MRRTAATPTPDELRAFPILADLTDDEAAWIAARCEVLLLDAGDVLFRVGEPTDWMYLTFSGSFEARRDDHGAGAPQFMWHGGDITGVLPFSRMTVAPSTGHALADSRVARFPRSEFGALLARVPRLEPRFVGYMADRVRETTRRDQQQEKLTALGRMAAGLAHELNNPAAAAQRFASRLARAVAALEAASVALSASGASLAAIGAVRATRDALRERLAATSLADEDGLARSEREEAIAEWLARAGVADPWMEAGALAESAVAVSDLDALAAPLPDDARAPAAAWLAASLAADGLIAGITDACGRITELVSSVKTYTHMDRSGADEDVDLRAGIESTLALFAHRLRARGVTLTRDFAPSLPRVHGRAGELNQVWTNLIDNASDAAAGAVTVRTSVDDGAVLVEVRDDGPGVPDELQSRIWEPFYTTKAVGQGTGLGLDIARRIVEQHGGWIALQSVPGDTRFGVRLPPAPAPRADAPPADVTTNE